MKVNKRLLAFFTAGLTLSLNVLAVNGTSTHYCPNNSFILTRVFPVFTALACSEKAQALMPKVARSSPQKKVFQWAPITIYQAKKPRQRYQRKVMKPLPPPGNEVIEAKYNLARESFKTSFELSLNSRVPKIEEEKIFALEKRLFSSLRELEKNKNPSAKDIALVIAEALSFSSFTPKIGVLILKDVKKFLASKAYLRASEQNKTLLTQIFIMELIPKKVDKFDNNLKDLALRGRTLLNQKLEKYLDSNARNSNELAKNSILKQLNSSLDNLDAHSSAERITWIIAEALAPIVWNHRSKTKIFTDDVQPFLQCNSYNYASDDKKVWLTQIFICETISQKLNQKRAEQTIFKAHAIQEKTRARNLFRDEIRKDVAEEGFKPIIPNERKRLGTLKKVKALADLQVLAKDDFIDSVVPEEMTPKAWTEQFEPDFEPFEDLEEESDLGSESSDMSNLCFKHSYDCGYEDGFRTGSCYSSKEYQSESIDYKKGFNEGLIVGEAELASNISEANMTLIDEKEPRKVPSMSECHESDGYESEDEGDEDESHLMVKKDGRNKKRR